MIKEATDLTQAPITFTRNLAKNFQHVDRDRQQEITLDLSKKISTSI